MIKFGEDATIAASVVLGVCRFCRGILMVVIVGMLVAVFVLVLVVMPFVCSAEVPTTEYSTKL